MSYSNRLKMAQQQQAAAEQKREEIQSERLAAAKLGIHASERVMTQFLQLAFDYSKATDLAIIAALKEEEAVAEILKKNTECNMEAFGSLMTLCNKGLDLIAAKHGLVKE